VKNFRLLGKRKFSLKSVLLLGGALSTAFAVTLAIFIYKNLLRNVHQIQVRTATSELMYSAVSQVQRLLPGLLISEAAEGNELYLRSIMVNEGLRTAELVPKPNMAQLDCTEVATDAFVCSDNIVGQIEVFYPIRTDAKDLVYLRKVKPLEAVNYLESFKASFVVLLIAVCMIILGFVFFLLAMVDRHVRRPLEELDRKLLPVLDGSSKEIEFDGSFSEIQSLYKKLSSLISDYVVRKSEATYATVARQVAHDIRSPLTAIKVLAERCDELGDENRALLRAASKRITGIADDLLTKSKSVRLNMRYLENTCSEGEGPLVEFSLAALCRGIVSQKQIEFQQLLYSSKLDLKLIVRANAVVSIDEKEITRVLSNLINNAIEATDGEGEVAIIVDVMDKNGVITISDDGKGIPEEDLVNMGMKGFTRGKENGSGLGVHHAFETMHFYGGKIDIKSKVGLGTQVIVQIPLAVSQRDMTVLDIRNYKSINVVDDDPSVHLAWKRIIDGKRNISAFMSPGDYIQRARTSDSETLNIIDFEFKNDAMNGIEFIAERLDPQNSILVTSHGEPWIRSQCSKFGIRVVSKEQLHSLRIRS
jgi:signal transduction histidine kinase